MKSRYVLMDLEENDKLTTLLSNKTAKKIIRYLSEHEEATQSQLAEKLDIAQSTIHYNLEQLQDAGLVEWEHYHYSQKGKEVRHYRLAQQYIIITPKKSKNVLEQLKDILPAFIVGIGGTAIVAFSHLIEFGPREEADMMMQAERSIQTTQYVGDSWLWFLTGVIVALLTYIITIWLKNRK